MIITILSRLKVVSIMGRKKTSQKIHDIHT